MRWTRKIKTAMPVEQNGHFFTTRHTIFSPYFNRATAVLRNVIWNFIFSPTTVLCYLTRRLTRYLCSSTPPVIVVAENITVIFQLNDWNKYTYIYTYIHTYIHTVCICIAQLTWWHWTVVQKLVWAWLWWACKNEACMGSVPLVEPWPLGTYITHTCTHIIHIWNIQIN